MKIVLAASDLSKEPSAKWPTRSLQQWIEDIFGYDSSNVVDHAYQYAFEFLRPLLDITDADKDADDYYSVTAICENPSITCEILADCWNHMWSRLEADGHI